MMTCSLCIKQDKVFKNKESFKTHLYRKHKSDFNRPQEAEKIDIQSTNSPQNTFTLDPPSDFHLIFRSLSGTLVSVHNLYLNSIFNRVSPGWLAD
jgi:hypothetical protein